MMSESKYTLVKEAGLMTWHIVAESDSPAIIGWCAWSQPEEPKISITLPLPVGDVERICAHVRRFALGAGSPVGLPAETDIDALAQEEVDDFLVTDHGQIETREIVITLSAMTRQELPLRIHVPADISMKDFDKLTMHLRDWASGSYYTEDMDYWEENLPRIEAIS